MAMGNIVVDRMSTEVIQANLLWGVMGGLLGLFAGLLGVIGLVIGIIALALAWFWGKASSRVKMALFGFGLVSLFVGLFSMFASAATSSLGLTPKEVAGLGWFGSILSIPNTINQYIGLDQALLNTTIGVPTSAGVAALSRITGGTTSTGGSTGGGATG